MKSGNSSSAVFPNYMHIPTKFLLSHSWTLDNPGGGAYGCHPKSVVVYPYTYDVAYGQQDTFKNIVGFKDSIR